MGNCYHRVVSDDNNNNEHSDLDEDPTLELEPLSEEDCARLMRAEDFSSASDSVPDSEEARLRPVETESSMPGERRTDIQELQDALTFRDEMNSILQLGIDQQREKCRELEEQIGGLRSANTDISHELEKRRKQVAKLERKLEKTRESEHALLINLRRLSKSDKSNAAFADQNDTLEELKRNNLRLTETVSALEEELDLARRNTNRPETRLREEGNASEKISAEPKAGANLVAADRDEGRSVLVSLDDSLPGRYPLRDGIVTVGSSSDSDIQIQSHFISRHHAQFVNTHKGCVVGDLNSTNGTYVNSRRINKRVLRVGDVVTVGKHRFRYEERSGDATDRDGSDYGYGVSSRAN